ncbi:MAG TPA: thrombospondin type 3 repeat-containing protein [Chthoniobacter sp.]
MSAVRRGAIGFGLGLMLFLLAFVGFGWAIQTNQYWLYSLLGDARIKRFYAGYAHTAEGLLPEDHDGDGVSDGVELWLGTNPLNSSLHPHFLVDCGTANSSPPWTNFAKPRPCLLDLRPTERAALRGIVEIVDIPNDVGYRFPRTFQLRITPPKHVQIAQPGGELSTGPIVVPVTVDGSFMFDLLPEADFSKVMGGNLFIDNARTSERLLRVFVSPNSRH